MKNVLEVPIKPFPEFVDENNEEGALFRNVGDISFEGWVVAIQKSKFEFFDYDVVLSTMPPLLAGQFRFELDGNACTAWRTGGAGRLVHCHILILDDLNYLKNSFEIGNKLRIEGVETSMQYKNISSFRKTPQVLQLLGVEPSHPLHQAVINDASSAAPCPFFILTEAAVLRRAIWPFNMSPAACCGSKLAGQFGASSAGAVAAGNTLGAQAMQKVRRSKEQQSQAGNSLQNVGDQATIKARQGQGK